MAEGCIGHADPDACRYQSNPLIAFALSAPLLLLKSETAGILVLMGGDYEFLGVTWFYSAATRSHRSSVQLPRKHCPSFA